MDQDKYTENIQIRTLSGSESRYEKMYLKSKAIDSHVYHILSLIMINRKTRWKYVRYICSPG